MIGRNEEYNYLQELYQILFDLSYKNIFGKKGPFDLNKVGNDMRTWLKNVQ